MQKSHVEAILFSEHQIHQRIAEMVDALARDMAGADLVIIGILRGSFMFMADLVRALNAHHLHPRIDFIALESYGAGTTSSGTVKLTKDVGLSVAGARVLLVDDILDSGRTLDYARRHLLTLGAREVRTCVLLDKPSRRVIPMTADYTGFPIPDQFVIGYGLDYDSRYRELPYLGLLSLD